MIRWAVWLCFVGATAVLAAEDRIVMRTASGSRIGIPCLILDYTGREATYQLKPGGGTRRLPRREIVEVTTHYTPAHAEARDLFTQGKAREAFTRLDVALEQEQRKWVRREILALQIQCALWNGDRATAGERFLAIFESDSETLYFRLMPLAWSEDGPPPDLARLARQWMSDPGNAAAALLGASHLLTLPDQSATALATLKTLARHENYEIQRYAQIQLWRAKALTEDVSRDELRRWERSFEEASRDLGGGPRYVLGLGWHRQHDDAAAAAAWLWLPFVSGDDRWLAAQAAWNAGQALTRAGQFREATALFEEIGRRYADTPFGPRAAAIREQMLSGTDGRD